MARNVTEEELDALLAEPAPPARSRAGMPPADGSGASAVSADVSVESRDFREPRWLSPDDLDAFRTRAKSAALALVDALRASLPRAIELAHVEVNEDSAESCLRTEPPCCVLASESGAGLSLARIDRSSALYLAELALGTAVAAPSEAIADANRALTPLESEIVERLLSRALSTVASALGVATKEPRLFAEARDLERALANESDRRRLAVRVAITAGESELVLHCLLANAVAPKKLAVSAPQRPTPKAALPSDVASTRVEVSAVLGETEIMLTDLLALEAGDLIPLSLAPGDPIVVRIEGEPCGRARFGERDGRMAVRLTEILRQPQHR
jgi:flagellar motor switch protein FliM